MTFFNEFGKKWASEGSVEPISETQKKSGWDFLGSVPPISGQFNLVQQNTDEKINYLFNLINSFVISKGGTLNAVSTNALRDILNNLLMAVQGGHVGYATKDGMLLDTTQEERTIAEVLSDPVAENNGFYLWLSGEWVKQIGPWGLAMAATDASRIAAEEAAADADAAKTEAQTAAGLAVDAQADIHTNWQDKLDIAAQYASDVEDIKTEIRNWYYGPLNADPVTRPDGTPVQVGDEYHDSVNHVRKVYANGSWEDVSTAALAMPGGASLVGNAVMYVSSLKDLPSAALWGLRDGQIIETSNGGSYAWDKQEEKFIPKNNGFVTFIIPDDFDNLQDAFNYLSGSKIPNAGRIILRIRSGHIVRRGLNLREGDYSKFRIVSDDPVVIVGEEMNEWLFKFEHCIAPAIQCMFDAQGNGIGGCWYLISFGFIYPGAGVINSGGRGLEVATSVVDANETIWDGALARGVRASNGGILKIRYASAQNCGEEGLAVSDAYVSAQYSNFSGNRLDNINITNASRACLLEVVANNSLSNNIIVGAGSIVDADRASFTNAGIRGAVINNGGIFVANGADFRGASSDGISVLASTVVIRGSKISDATINSGSNGILAREKSNVIANNAICNNAGINGIRSESWSEVSFMGGTAIDCASSSFSVSSGGSINIVGSAGVLPNVPINTISNKGFVISDIITKNKGIATLKSSDQNVVVNHGLGITPSPSDIIINLLSDLGGASYIWVSDVDATSFKVNINEASESDILIGWLAEVRDI